MYLSSGEMDRPVAVPLDRGYRDHLAGREAEKPDRSTAIRVGLPEIDSFADQRERVPGKGRQNFRLLTAAHRTSPQAGVEQSLRVIDKLPVSRLEGNIPALLRHLNGGPTFGRR